MLKPTILAALACAAVCACATTPSAHLTTGKALADAWSAFDGASVTLDALATSGNLSAGERATLAADLPKVRDGLDAATKAYENGQDASASQNVASVTALIAVLVQIVADHKGA